MNRIRKKIARINYRILYSAKGFKAFTIYSLIIIVGATSFMVALSGTFELLFGIPISIIRNQDLVQILTIPNRELILGRLFAIFTLIQVVIIYILSLFCSLLCMHCMFRVDDDIKKLPEIIIPEAKKFINECPGANPILAPLIHEVKNKDDGEDLLKILNEFYRLRLLEGKPEYLRQTAEEEIKEIKEEEAELRKKLGLV